VRSFRPAVALLALLLLGGAACTDSEPSPVVETTTSVTAAASTSVATVTTVTRATGSSSTSTTVSAAQEIRITVAGSQVTGGGRHKVPRGATVRIIVTADVSDEVHLHGYDKKADVTPAAPATIELVANIPGVFEIELEKRAKQLAQLEVTG
jgi:hypothetical protein